MSNFKEWVHRKLKPVQAFFHKVGNWYYAKVWKKFI